MILSAKFSRLFSRSGRKFDLAADEALDLFKPSATAAPRSPGAGCPADTSPPRVLPGPADGLAAPTSPGAASHPSQWPVDYKADRQDLDRLRELVGHLADTAADVIEHIDHLDPTPTGLAQAAAVTDLAAHRR